MRTTGIFAATVCAVGLAALPPNAPAAFKGGGQPYIYKQSGGFNGPGLIPVSVEQARLTGAENRVVVRGNIKQQVGREHYVLEDETSSILIVIPEDRWLGQHVTPDDLLELHGEVRKTPGSVVIRVAKLVKMR